MKLPEPDPNPPEPKPLTGRVEVSGTLTITKADMCYSEADMEASAREVLGDVDDWIIEAFSDQDPTGD